MQQKRTTQPSKRFEQPDLYINRELSWIEFNRRVFQEAQDSRHPLLERIKFMSIFETNLDEFIMIRLAGIKDQMASAKVVRSHDGRTPEQQLTAIREVLLPLVQEVRTYWRETLLPLLAEYHIHILDYEQLDKEQRDAMLTYFQNDVFPVLTPLAVDQGHPFPHISNRSLNFAVVIYDASIGEKFARLKVPPSLPRFVPVPVVPEEETTVAFVWLEQVIAAHISQLFPGFDVWESFPFRVLRDADIELREEGEDDDDDLLEYIEQEIRKRRFGSAVDLAINPSMPQHVRSTLLDKMEITEQDLTVIDGPLGMGDVMELYSLDRPDLKDAPFVPRIPAFLSPDNDLFATIQQQDLLVHHPYDSFNSVVEFIRAAAHDPHVLAIKQTLYRVGSNSPVVRMLLEAVENGKQVATLVELKARFDEESNIGWARDLEQAGVHVVYGLTGLKTHAKVAMVVRKEERGLRRYIHLGTGNYNASTAKIYEDVGFFTCRPDIGADVTDLFNALTGYSRQSTYRTLMVAPLGLRTSIIERIEREIKLHKKYSNGRLIFKMNSLTDPGIVGVLYKAAQAGVEIDLIIRGACCLRPGIPDTSETIHVRSLVGRFLEHSRIYYFGNNEEAEIFLGSADMMQRNLNTRVETLFPIDSAELRQAIYNRVIEPIMADNVNAHILHADGHYTRIRPKEGEEPFDSQTWFIHHPLFEPEELDTDHPMIRALSSNA
jgi:polyphosphate kinase